MRLIISPGICGSKERRLEDGGDDKDEERREEDMTRYLKRSANSCPDAASLLDERRVCTSWGNYAVSHGMRKQALETLQRLWDIVRSMSFSKLVRIRKARQAIRPRRVWRNAARTGPGAVWGSRYGDAHLQALDDLRG